MTDDARISQSAFSHPMPAAPNKGIPEAFPILPFSACLRVCQTQAAVTDSLALASAKEIAFVCSHSGNLPLFPHSQDGSCLPPTQVIREMREHPRSKPQSF